MQGMAETSDEKLLDELIFKQDLNEVHLLIDMVSGRADRSLGALSVPDPEDPSRTMTGGEVMRAIAEMRYPPQGMDAVTARNAALLLLAKDRLSMLAAPANGLTIAYTRLFIDQESSWFAGRLWRWRRQPEQQRNPRHNVRVDLAQRSFPGLQAHARRFSLWRDALIPFSMLWLLLTALAYWDAGLGRIALERLDQDWKNVVSELTANPALLACPGSVETGEPAVSAAESADDAAMRKAFACRRYNYLKIAAQTAGQQVNDVFRCENIGVSWPVHAWCWHWLLPGNAAATEEQERGRFSTAQQPRARQRGIMAAADPIGQKPGQAPADDAAGEVSSYAKANVAYWQTATSILSVFTAYILPMMFALLGTLIGAFRAILNRIGRNELAPRDLVQMQIGIPTGLVAGIAVGLFLSPSSVPMQGAGGVSSQLTLTASGLGFLAGYASYSFFGFLDNVIRTVFPFGSPAAASADGTAPGPAPATQTPG